MQPVEHTMDAPASPPDAGTLQAVLCTGELDGRPVRPPDHAAENRALLALARCLAEAPHDMPRTLAAVALDLLGGGSAGVSLVSPDGTQLHWPAVVGAWQGMAGQACPRHASPCGIALDANAVQLFCRPERCFSYLEDVRPVIEEALCAPVSVDGRPVGTLWVAGHAPGRRFDAEDRRLLEHLVLFAASSWRVLGASAREEQAPPGHLETRARAVATLNELGSSLWQTRSRLDGLQDILGATMRMLRADLGNIQILDPRRGVLRIEAQHGFDRLLVEHFEAVVDTDPSACGRALQLRRRVMIEDVAADAASVSQRPMAREAGFRAVQSTPLVGRDGRLLGVLSTHWQQPHRLEAQDEQMLDLFARQAGDFIERCQFDEALTHHAEQVEILVNRAPLGIFMVDADFRIRVVNPVARPAFGALAVDVEGRDFGAAMQQLWEPAFAEELTRIFARTLETGQSHVERERAEWRRDRGVFEYYEWRVDRIALPDGQRGVVCYFRDISEQVRAREILSRAEGEREQLRRHYEAILSNTPDLAYVFDLDHRFVYANEVLLRMWGKTAEEALGRNCLELGYEPWHAAMHDREIEQVVATRRPVRGEVPFTGTFGRHIYDYIFVPVLDGQGRVEAVAGTTRDVTERKEAEQVMTLADQKKDEFLAMLAHELRNPLAPIRNAVRLLESRAGDEHAVRATAGMLDRQVTQMVHLVDDLLDVNRITQGKIELALERAVLADLVRDAVDVALPLFTELGHELEVCLPAEPVELTADPTRLTQMLGNLLNNAGKFTPRGGHVRLSAERLGDEVCIRVKDDGVGIDADQLPSIFELFTQVDSSLERSQSGLGIGLTLVQRLVEMHGGSIQARSAGLGRGSEFELRLPVADAPMVQALQPKPVAEPKGPLRILLVDDNEDAAESLAAVLALDGHDVQTVYDGLAALDAAQAHDPDVILLDIGLPGLSGYEVARRLRERPSGKPLLLVALTGWGQDDDRRRSREAGFDVHLVKPVDIDALLALLPDGGHPA